MSVDEIVEDIHNRGVDAIVSAVSDIRAMSESDETNCFARDNEDNLHVSVLLAIATGHPNAQNLATQALQTQEIEFPRYTM